MEVVTVACESCNKDTYINKKDFPLFCPFCGNRSLIYYKAEEGKVTLYEIESNTSKRD